ncbi:hypothetical protein GCM10028824_00240 [Hymenobacter segetis]|uniref:DUF262 domain-containing protein n=1 Tax=Hymenobacter segetis TaxID=2025509 RepID=A0ABU9M0N0_9BACT
MAIPKNLVNLDAMLSRADFAQNQENENSYETITGISIRDLSRDGMTGKILRKPDFQRETSHWTPEQVVSLLECFLNGDLIPSVILWKAPIFLFVIDGGHRLSVLKAWTEDDYGDGPLSVKYFGDAMSENQLKAAAKTRKLVAESIGTYQHFKNRIDNSDFNAQTQSIITRTLQLQWVSGDAGKAESSFFKINSQGTALDDMEEMLLRYRHRPIAIAARAIIRAGKGNKYWSAFPADKAAQIEELARVLHRTLFDPEVPSVIKTLELPLGGAKGIRSALQLMIDYLGIAAMKQVGRSIVIASIESGENDESGDSTIEVLKKARKLSDRFTGNEHGSLGLHPAIYFYGPSGVHSAPLFLGTAKFLNLKILNNDNNFFKQFTSVREQIEKCLVQNKELISTILQKVSSRRRTNTYALIISNIFINIKSGKIVSEEDLVDWAGLLGKIVIGGDKTTSTTFSETTKSKIFINMALGSAQKCSICGGYLDQTKSASYDHIIPRREGGLGSVSNGQIVHPYCNQGYKS